MGPSKEMLDKMSEFTEGMKKHIELHEELNKAMKKIEDTPEGKACKALVLEVVAHGDKLQAIKKQVLQEMAKEDPDMAKEMAKKFNIDIETKDETNPLKKIGLA